MPKRIKLIANPASGSHSRPLVDEAIACLEVEGARVDLFLTGKPGDATAEAMQVSVADYDLVVAAGGDGTLNEVANGLLDRGVPLAFLPLGTANVMAFEMGIPSDMPSACRIALGGEARAINLAECGGRVFLMMAGVGFDASAVRAVCIPLKKYCGRFAYVMAGVQALFTYAPRPLTLTTAAGETTQVWHAIISNIRLYGGRFVMADQGGLLESGLVASVVERPGRLALLCFWLRILFRGRLIGVVRQIESTSFSLLEPGAPVQIDGDEHADTPIEIGSRFGQLSLVFPVAGKKDIN